MTMGGNLIVYNGTALTMNKHSEIIRDAVIEIRNGRIQSIHSEPGFVPTRSKFDSPITVNARGGLILPGLVNCHTHVSMSLLRGIAEDLPLEKWLGDVIFPLEKKWVSPDFVYDGAILSCLEMIQTGTTLFNDMYYFEEHVAKAVQASGLRAICGHTVIEREGTNATTAMLNELDTFLEKVSAYDRVVPSVAPHAIYDVSLETFKALQDYASRNKIPIHMHLSEKQNEVDACLKIHGVTPVGYLDKLDFWKARVIVAHAVCLTNDDIEILGRNHVKISHNPESNFKLGTKIAPVVPLQKKGAIVGLGTDGPASNNNLDLLQEAGFAAKIQSFREGPGVLTAEAVVRMLTIDGARVLGFDDRLGSLEAGKLADLIVVDIQNAHSQPLYNPYAHLVYSATGADVRHTIVGGNILMEDFVVRRLDEASILSNALRWGERIAPGKNFSPRAKARRPE
jgi:5-methylthioadenosine/S-adenosylhomocysteine deaminase